MQIKFNLDKTRVLFFNEGPKEYKAMMNFPAFMKEGPVFWVPSKIAVVYNLITRLKSTFKTLKVDKDVHDFMNQDMKLLPLPEDFKFHTKPMEAQQIALRYMYTVGNAGLLMDPGMGKSKVVLDYIHLMGFKKTLLVCPLPLLFVWEDEVAIHRPELSIHLVTTTDWDKEIAAGGDKDIFCMNYNKAVLFKDKLMKQGFEFMHLDEFLIKDVTTERTKALTAISRVVPYKCGGSGTLINNSVMDMYAPIRYLEPSLVGFNYKNFMNRHLYKSIKDPRIILGATKVPEARSVLESCCIVMSKDEWLKLPGKHFHDIIVQPNDAQREFSTSLVSNMIAKLKDEFVEVDNALVMMAKLYQASNGFVYVSDKVDDKADIVDLLAEETPVRKKKSPRRTVFFDEQPKIQALDKLIKETLKGKRAIIWFNMAAEYTLIKEYMDKNGYTYSTIKGGTKNLGAIVREYNSNPEIQFLIAQSKSVNYGITILGTSLEKLEEREDFEAYPGINPSVHTQIFYSCNFSLEVFLQQQDRIHRIGQTHECDYYRIWLNTKVEMTIRNALRDKMNIRRDMLVDIAEKLKTLEGEDST